MCEEKVNNFLFNQNEGIGGFQNGKIDVRAVQPVTVNWTRQSRFMGPNNPGIKWELEFNDEIFCSSPVVGREDTIYFGTAYGFLYAVQSDGSIKWKLNLGKSLETPVIAEDGTIYIATIGDFESKNHNLYAVSSEGIVKWSFKIDDLATFSPVIAKDGTVYVTTDGPKLFAISPDGSLKWIYKGERGYWSNPVLSNDNTIYIGSRNNLYAIDERGKEKWKVSIARGSDNASPVITDDGTLLFSAYDNQDDRSKLYAVNRDGTIRWIHTPDEVDIVTPPSLGKNGTIYVGGTYFELMAIGLDNSLKWSTKVEGFQVGPSLIGADGVIYVGTYNNVRRPVSKVFAIHEDGTKKWLISIKGEMTWPALGDKMIYVLLGDFKSKTSKLVAIGEK
ncbi:PQQ-binding-like beta-propeller repeat protein [Aneurinibacillus uraniidurans]|uniref:PQQ-binding-like beta-propeller repeat protein n=1 Tax=Aneurinibacillus uraniidurans TaxID=2966586 RepID=UPI00234B4AA0|nr:PQQ-binding-like beta-propeller repeat protein [Aneurinibacillus sp. B1]WCN36802.1 PQQ-binding-like beta-propeller repeat protein [Aneurinibacillus sp. B1]